MQKKTFALAAGALALLLLSSTFDPADARGRGGGGGGRGFHGGGHARAFSGRAFSGGSSFRSSSFAGRSFHHRRHIVRGFAVGVPLAYGAYYYANGCDWLRRRAVYSGSGYWWDRYNACLYGDY